MPTADIIALLDRLNPKQVSLHWLLDDAALVVGSEQVWFKRAEMQPIQEMLSARRYKLIKTDIDPRGGMEGELIYERGG